MTDEEDRNQKLCVVTISFFFRVKQIYADIDKSIENRSIHVDFQLSKLPIVISRVTALMGILVRILLYYLYC
jgi:hypothetical protein